MDLIEICRQFGIKGEHVETEMLKSGNINSTYKVTFNESGKEISYVIQKINTYVFKNPDYIMANIKKVTGHISYKLPEEKRTRGVLSYLERENGDNFLIDEDSFWRGYTFIENSVTYNNFADLELLEGAGRAFGEFQTLLSDFDASVLFEIIPNFHNTKARIERLIEIAEQDPAGRLDSVKEEMDFILENKEIGESLCNMLDEGTLPLRVTHNDTKGNNVLFDPDTKKTLAVIDLDTVMPGLIAYDFGDAVRFAANNTDEDDPDISKVYLCIERFEAFAKGFVPQIKHGAIKAELDTLALGAIVMTYELAVRFLDDYIAGDKYFKVLYPEHNIVRARNQIALCKDMLAKRELMEETVRKYTA